MKSKTSKKAEKEFEEQAKEIGEIMKKALGKEQLAVKIEKLKNKKVASVLTLSEQTRRMQDMMKMYAIGGMPMGDMGAEGETLVLNANHPLVEYVTANKDSENAATICKQLYDLAKIQQAPLSPEEMAEFVSRSNEIMLLLTK